MSLELFKLDGRVALITGGTRGLGFVMAQALAEAGASVIVTSREREKAEAAAGAIAQSTGQRTLGLAVDVTVAEQVEAMVASAVEAFGRIDILINNAGVNVRKPIEDYDEASWDLVQNTNLKAPFLCARAVAKKMKSQRYGRVINMSSMLGSIALPERGAYCSSKGGLIQLTKVLALEWAPFNITVNALCPGPIATELNTVVMNNPEANRFFVDNIALGRWGRPEEIIGAVIYMASDASSFMTGASMVVDGGWTAR
ncbi:3-oxoacyl-ACP reductase FabG [Paenibacillus sp. HWE-109]|uniref:SDR family NAD(P)-dependent oxidoreductase n=1 Tax=Paenibacillus sp. HWE-109 TaxID=1306526 RepID=UPI001EDD2B65|nr:3-oxoacyl-ACP reductase family protein [Paenibacillus sp. HWE-109]UKS25466.1 3-oxoacyl-ACP reductase FabG [Paenibacillus sp. HWE-109]